MAMAEKFPFSLNYHHTGIVVSDMERSKKWYHDILGFETMFENTFPLPGQLPPKMCWMKHGNHYIELYQYPNDLEPFSIEAYNGSLGTKHVSYWIDDSQFDAFIDFLTEKNITFTWGIPSHTWPTELCGRPNGCRVTYFNDPDGIPIEVHESFTPGEY